MYKIRCVTKDAHQGSKMLCAKNWEEMPGGLAAYLLLTDRQTDIQTDMLAIKLLPPWFFRSRMYCPLTKSKTHWDMFGSVLIEQICLPI